MVPEGLQLFVKLTPGSGRDDIDGVEEGADERVYLKARVRAVPDKGKANKALIALLAKRCGIPKSRIKIKSGETNRLKTLLLEGESGVLREALSKLKY
ncbi:MAG: DUF167 domain-containing protein [Hyphomicrobiales bacterium]|nr:DUF167 domain-containing protein [Hyphomicrobiales bacterium]